MAVKILESTQAHAMLQRMALQMLEHNFGAPAINLAGVSIRGQYLAKRLAALMQAEGLSQVHQGHFNDDFTAWAETTAFSFSTEHPLVLVDDVLYTGRTLFKALHTAGQAPHKSLQIAILIDRGHHLYPLSPDVMGLRLATTLQEYIRVAITPNDGTIEAFLEDEPVT